MNLDDFLEAYLLDWDLPKGCDKKLRGALSEAFNYFEQQLKERDERIAELERQKEQFTSHN